MVDMSSRIKRSDSYRLRRKLSQKKLEVNFEYNFSQVNSFTTFLMNHKLDNPEDFISKKLVGFKQKGKANKLKGTFESNLVQDKRCRPFSKIVSLDHKSEELKAAKILYIEPFGNSEGSTMEVTSGCNGAAMKVSHEEIVDNSSGDFVWRGIKMQTQAENCTGKETTHSLEECESLSPEVEKENLPSHSVALVNVGSSALENEIILEFNTNESKQNSECCETFEDCFEILRKKNNKNVKKQFKIQQHLKSKRSTSDHKIKCNECNKLLKPSSFRQHLRTHTGEKPFCCTVCDARFTRKGDVERHIRIVHDKKKPFKCERCSRAFGDKKNLRWHVMNHDKKLFYICDTCGFKFGKREYWENHVRFLHPLPGGLDPSKVHVGCDENDNSTVTEATSLENSDKSVLPLPVGINSNNIICSWTDIPSASFRLKETISESSIVTVSDLVLPKFVKMEMLDNDNEGETGSIVVQFDDLGLEEDPAIDHIGLPLTYNAFTDLINPSNSIQILHSDENDKPLQPIIIKTVVPSHEIEERSNIKGDTNLPLEGEGQSIASQIGNTELFSGVCDIGSFHDNNVNKFLNLNDFNDKDWEQISVICTE